MTDISDAEIGRAIQKRRNTLGMSQGDLARELQEAGLNWSQGTLSKVEAGMRPVRLSEVLTLAKVLDLAVRELLEPVDALSSVVIRLSAEREQIAQRLRHEKRELEGIDAARAALQTLTRRSAGASDKSNLSLSLLIRFAFDGLQLHEVVGILEQLGVARDALEPYLPSAFANSPSARSGNPSPEFIKAVIPLLRFAAPELDKPSADSAAPMNTKQAEVEDA